MNGKISGQKRKHIRIDVGIWEGFDPLGSKRVVTQYQMRSAHVVVLTKLEVLLFKLNDVFCDNT